jgi:hypothetical protein
VEAKWKLPCPLAIHPIGTIHTIPQHPLIPSSPDALIPSFIPAKNNMCSPCQVINMEFHAPILSPPFPTLPCLPVVFPMLLALYIAPTWLSTNCIPIFRPMRPTPDTRPTLRRLHQPPPCRSERV